MNLAFIQNYSQCYSHDYKRPMLSLVLTLIMIVSHLQPTMQAMVIGTRAETSITLVCLAFSITLVAIITGPGHGLAVDNDGSIAYGNQYYFSWVSLFTMLYLTQFLIEKKFGINVTDTMRMRSKSFSYWVALVFCSIVVMGSSSEYYGRNCSGKGGNKPQPFCSRTAFGISVGLVGLVFASGIVAMKIMHGVAASYLIEVGFAVWLFILYLLEVGFVTDNQGPGAPLGTCSNSAMRKLVYGVVLLHANIFGFSQRKHKNSFYLYWYMIFL